MLLKLVQDLPLVLDKVTMCEWEEVDSFVGVQFFLLGESLLAHFFQHIVGVQEGLGLNLSVFSLFDVFFVDLVPDNLGFSGSQVTFSPLVRFLFS